MSKVNEEYIRLKKLFEVVDDSKKELIDELLKKAAFLKVELDNLEDKIHRFGAVEVSNKGNKRESIYYKTYLVSVSIYQGLIITLNIVLGSNVIDDDDSLKKHESLICRYNKAREIIDNATRIKVEKTAKATKLNKYLETIKSSDLLLTEWSDEIWYLMVEKAITNRDGSIDFYLIDGKKINVFKDY